MTRGEALKVLDTIPTIGEQVDALEMAIQALERDLKVGNWLEKEINSDTAIMVWQSARCSVCDKYHTTPYMYYFSHYDYCPHCGARMEVEE